jgi:hypothetical protein
MDDTLDVESLGAEMLAAVRAAIAGHGPALKALTEMELRRLAGAMAEVASLLARGETDRESAQNMVNIYRFSVHSVLRTVEGLALLSADKARDAAIGAAAAVVNRIAGFKLL